MVTPVYECPHYVELMTESKMLDESEKLQRELDEISENDRAMMQAELDTNNQECGDR